MKRRYTWKPDIPDPRDHEYGGGAPSLPALVDLRPQCPPVYDQGQLGSCTGNAWAGMVQFLDVKAQLAQGQAVPSRLFIYYNERVIEGTVRHDDGAQIRDGAKALKHEGVCAERLWPYRPSKYAVKPPAAAFKAALGCGINHYLRCTAIDHFLHCLADGFPVVFGFNVPASFESAQVAKTGVLPMPVNGTKYVGGHAVLAVGYDSNRDVAFVRNSWGAAWGQDGYFEMPLEMIRSRKYSDDFWTARR